MYELKKQEPAWLTLIAAPEVKVLMEPVSRAMKRNARAAAREALGEGSTERLGADEVELLGDAFSRELIRQGIRDWSGIGNAGGKAIPVSPEAIETFLDDEVLFDAADRLYVMPVILRDREKNASSVSPNGTGEAATPAPITAGSPANIAAAVDAPAAPTASKRRKPKTAGTSGNC